jgi:ABC-2 type transport system permease protein
MTKFWIVFFHTYKKHLLSKSFFISSIVTMILISALTNMGHIAQKNEQTNPKEIGIVASEALIKEFMAKAVHDKKLWNIKTYPTEDQAKKAIDTHTIIGYVALEEKDAGIKGTYKANELVNQVLVLELETFLGDIHTQHLYKNFQLTEQQTMKLQKPFSLEKEALQSQAKSAATIQQSNIVIAILLVLIYASVVFYGSTIAFEVASEKSSRIMEVLVSSTPPVQQMFGKIFAVATLGLTQYGIFFLTGRASYVQNTAGSFLKFDQVPTSTFVYAVVFFILGYFLYSTLLAMVGSLVSRIEEAYQMIAPINFFMIAGFVLSLIGLADPTSPVITVASYIPFFTPMLFFLRVSLLSIPGWQIAVAIGIMIGTILLFGYVGAKIYKGGVLIYGKSTFKNIAKALQITKKK